MWMNGNSMSTMLLVQVQHSVLSATLLRAVGRYEHKLIPTLLGSHKKY